MVVVVVVVVGVVNYSKILFDKSSFLILFLKALKDRIVFYDPGKEFHIVLAL